MYTCKTSFTAENGNYYLSGNHCTSIDYDNLTYDEQMNFFHDQNGTYQAPPEDDIVDDAIDIGIGSGIASMLSDDISTDFSGMGGGDFGGGGASSDW